MTEVEEGDQLMEESLSQAAQQPNSGDPFTKFSGTFDDTKKLSSNRIHLLDKFTKSLDNYDQAHGPHTDEEYEQNDKLFQHDREKTSMPIGSTVTPLIQPDLQIQ